MKIFESKQIAKIDAYTIEHEPISSVDLMERAASILFDWIAAHFPAPQNCKLFVGPGNNGGDGLALARMLAEKDYVVEVFLVRTGKQLSEDAEINMQRLKISKKVTLYEMLGIESMPWLFPDDLVIDALFGSGLSRPLEGLALSVVKAINASEAKVVAIDIPSGLMGEDNSRNNYRGIVRADFTLSFNSRSWLSYFRKMLPLLASGKFYR